MPADHSFRVHDEQNVGPSRPFAFQHGELLPQSQDFQKSMHATPEEYADGRQKCEDQIEHE